METGWIRKSGLRPFHFTSTQWALLRLVTRGVGVARVLFAIKVLTVSGSASAEYHIRCSNRLAVALIVEGFVSVVLH